MRFSLLVAVLCCMSPLFGQNIKIIDKSKKTAQIFDESDPHSLISLIKADYSTLSYYRKVGISEEDLATLTSEQRRGLTRFYGEQKDVPLIDQDPNSEYFGEPLIEEDSLTGDLYFVYPPPDTLYTDLNGISRIVLEYISYDPSGKSVENIFSVTFCKMYSDTYVPVLRVSGGEILRLSGFEYFAEIGEVETEMLLSEAKGSYWRQLYDSVSYATEDYYLDLNYMPGRFSMMIRNDYDSIPSVMFLYEILGGDGFHYTDGDDYVARYPFDYFYGDSVRYMKDVVGFMKQRFDPVVYTYYQSEYPLIDEDPDSPNFGNYITKEDENGDVLLLYPAPDIDFQWLGFKPRLYWGGVFNDREPFGITPDWMFLVETDGTEQHLVGIHSLNGYWSDLVSKSIVQYNWQTWHDDLDALVDKAKVYHTYPTKKRSKLNMSESFWRTFDDAHTPK